VIAALADFARVAVDHNDDLIVIVQPCRLRVIGRFDALDLIPERVRLIDADA
jgi:hypothetical protein